MYLQALAAFRDADNRPNMALCLNNAAVILHGDGRDERAIEMLTEAILLRRGLGDIHLTGRSLTNRGRSLLGLGRFTQAQRDFYAALIAARQAGDTRDEVVTLVNLDVLAQNQGRYGDALNIIEEALQLVKRSMEAPWAERQLFLLHNNRAVVYEAIGEYRLALAEYEGFDWPARSGPALMAATINEATVLRNLGDPNLALERLRRAGNALPNNPESRGLHAHLLTNIGLALQDLHRLPEAAAAVSEARRLAVEAGNEEFRIQAELTLGDIHLSAGDLHASETIYHRLLELNHSARTRRNNWEAYLGLARVQRARGENAAAIKSLRAGADDVEQGQANLNGIFSSRRYLVERLEVYALLAATLAESPAEGGALAGLEAAERSRSRLMAQHQTTRSNLKATAVPHPANIPDGTAYVEYMVWGSSSVVFWLTSRGIASHSLPPESRLSDMADDWLEALTSTSIPLAKEIEIGHRLYAAILKPVMDNLPPGIHKLRIVPSGLLWALPLAALPRRPDLDRPQRMIEDMEIALLPSLSGLTGEPSSTGDGVRVPFAFFGPPDRLQQRLPGAGTEFSAVGNAMGPGGWVFTGHDATEERFRQLSAVHLSLLHLATHTQVDAMDAGKTGIAFSRPATGAGNAKNDGFLSLTELRDLTIKSDLTFLASCSGAIGDHLPGAGLASLSSGLLEAGSQNVIASLWDVEDISTQALVEQFYHRFGHGETVAASLRNAQRALMAKGGEIARPRHWAAWIMVGRGAISAPPMSKQRDWLPHVLALASLCLVALAMMRTPWGPMARWLRLRLHWQG